MMAISVGAGTAIIYEFTYEMEADQFFAAGAWFGAASLALMAPLMLLARRRASALLLFRALLLVSCSAPVLAAVLLAYWLEMRHFLFSGAALVAVFVGGTGMVLWNEAQRLRGKWQRDCDKLLAAWYSPELQAIDIDQVARRLDDQRGFFDAKSPRYIRHAALAALLLLIVVSRELHHFHLFLAFLLTAGALWWLGGLARLLLTNLLLARRVAPLGRPMTDEEIRSRKPRKQKRKR